MAYEFIKDVPAPQIRASRAREEFPFGDLIVGGEALFITEYKISTIRMKAWKFGKDNNSKFIVKPIEKDGVSGIGVWRNA